MHSNSKNVQKLQAEIQTKNIPQRRGQDLIQKTVNNPREDTDHTQQDNIVVKMQYGRTVKRPDRLTYKQTAAISMADMSATLG